MQMRNVQGQLFEQPAGSEARSLIKRHIVSYNTDCYGEMIIPESVLTQLSWLQGNLTTTNESNARLKEPSQPSFKLNEEIKRALARWNCFKLLLDGSDSAYQQFVAEQEKKLTLENFEILSNLIKKVCESEEAHQALEASAFITKSAIAVELATDAKANFSLDSEEFISDVVIQCPRIFAACEKLSEGAIALLPYIFLKNTHGRHMLYTEGGENMFEQLRKMIKVKSEFAEPQFELWFCRWIVNIAGFRGHVNPKGSIYLDQNTAENLLALKSQLDLLWKNAEYDVLQGYLSIRAEEMGVESLFLAHIGALMRLHTKKEGSELQKWYSGIQEEAKAAYEDSVRRLPPPLVLTTTYEPAVLDNLRVLGCSIYETIAIYMAIKDAALMAYRDAIDHAELDATKTRLCFNNIAKKENLEPLIAQFREKDSLNLQVALETDGNVTVKNLHQLTFKIGK